MTGNKAYLVEYQGYNGGPVAFGGSKGQITGKVKSSEAKNGDEKTNGDTVTTTGDTWYCWYKSSYCLVQLVLLCTCGLDMLLDALFEKRKLLEAWIKQLASPKQTALGKDFSNPLIVDSLLKTIWFINAPSYCNEALAIPGQTATGKESSNPLMAGSLPKTILPPKLLE
ncbi:hypothetical protein Tco_0026801 [Tanacetum coccineum]